MIKGNPHYFSRMLKIITNKHNYFSRMLDWYLHQCNGKWEKQFGIEIDTIDNPGWFIRIDLTHTLLEGKEFQEVRNEITEDNWIHCWIRDTQFQGGCDPSNLIEMIKIFVLWSEKYCSPKKQVSIKDSILYWVEKWYQFQCNGDWEHEFGVGIQSLANAKWDIQIDMRDSDFESINFERITINHSDETITCNVEQGAFRSQCSSYHLAEVIQVFHNWVKSVSLR